MLTEQKPLLVTGESNVSSRPMTTNNQRAIGANHHTVNTLADAGNEKNQSFRVPKIVS